MGLPHYGLNVKMRIDLVDLGDMDLFDENEIDVEENPTWLPFAPFKNEPLRRGPTARPTIPNSRPTIVTKELAQRLAGFSGVRIRYLPR